MTMSEKDFGKENGYYLADWLRYVAYPVMIRELPVTQMERQIVNSGWDHEPLTETRKFGLVMDGLATALNFTHRAANPQLPHKPLRRVILELWEESPPLVGNQPIYAKIKPGFSLSFADRTALFERVQLLVSSVGEVMSNPPAQASADILQHTWDELRRQWDLHPIRNNGYPSASAVIDDPAIR